MKMQAASQIKLYIDEDEIRLMSVVEINWLKSTIISSEFIKYSEVVTVLP